jgi:membrane protease YdiL (CAAX protease family)
MKRFESSISLKGLMSGKNRKPSIILLVAPVLLTIFKYFGSKSFYLQNLSSVFVFSNDPQLTGALYAFGSSFVLLGIVPALIVRFVFHEPLSAYGVQLGDTSFGLKAFFVIAPLMIIATYPSSSMSEFIAEYPLNPDAGATPLHFIGHALSYLFFYLGWEFCFRGFMQFGLREALGDWNAILVQTVVSCLLHIGKPAGETLSSIIGALVWGVVVFRSRSLLCAVLTHWLLGVSLDFFIVYA